MALRLAVPKTKRARRAIKGAALISAMEICSRGDSASQRLKVEWDDFNKAAADVGCDYTDMQQAAGLICP